MAVQMTKRHSVPVALAIDLADRTRERAVLDFIDQSWVSKDLQGLVAAIHAEGRLTPSLLIRAICSGQMRFAEQAQQAFEAVVASGKSWVQRDRRLHAEELLTHWADTV